MSRPDSLPSRSGSMLAIAIGLIAGLGLVGLSVWNARFEGTSGAELAIRINGIEQRMSRDVLLPDRGWVLEIGLPRDLTEETRSSLSVTLREERTGATIEIADRLRVRDDLATLVMPEALGLREGLLSIQATLTDDAGKELTAYRRVRIRSWLGGPPIGSRQIIHFDFQVDRDGDGRPDFERDLERFGLAHPDHPALAKRVAERVAERALRRVAIAYDDPSDPNRTGLERDQVYVRFLLEADPSPYVTRICVGGANHAYPGSVGNVRFDLRNGRKSSQECEGEPAAGLFPNELTIYEASPLYRETFGPFLAEQGGIALGAGEDDEASLELATAPPEGHARARSIAQAIAILGDALGSVMSHESAHALGLVPAGRPGVGLFGGSEDRGDAYAHNLSVLGDAPDEVWLMNVGKELRFEDLAGTGEAGVLRFRPLNYAYLKDRVVLVDDHRP